MCWRWFIRVLVLALCLCVVDKLPLFQQYSGQSEATKAKLVQAYPSSKLYTVTGAYNSTDPLDIQASQDDLVAVLIQKDPMGNKERWYVDNGGETNLSSIGFKCSCTFV